MPTYRKKQGERINNSQDVFLCPISMEATNTKGDKEVFKAFNEVSVLRYSAQSANLKIKIDGKGNFGFTLIREHPMTSEELSSKKKTWYEF